MKRQLRGVNVWTLESFLRHVKDGPQASGNSRYLPARPIPCDTFAGRVRAAWRCLTGRADLLVWPEQE